MLNTVLQRKHKWLGHVLRHEVLLRDIKEERMKGKATRGRKRLDMRSDFKMTRGYMEVKRAAEDGGLWSAKRRRKPKTRRRRRHCVLQFN